MEHWLELETAQWVFIFFMVCFCPFIILSILYILILNGNPSGLQTQQYFMFCLGQYIYK